MAKTCSLCGRNSTRQLTTNDQDEPLCLSCLRHHSDLQSFRDSILAIFDCKRSGEYERAVNLVNDVLSNFRRNADAIITLTNLYRLKAELCSRLDRAGETVAAYEKIIKISTGRDDIAIQTTLDLSRFHANQGHAELALRALESAIPKAKAVRYPELSLDFAAEMASALRLCEKRPSQEFKDLLKRLIAKWDPAPALRTRFADLAEFELVQELAKACRAAGRRYMTLQSSLGRSMGGSARDRRLLMNRLGDFVLTEPIGLYRKMAQRLMVYVLLL